jgi:ABC-2 type transport system permease protein
MFLYGFAISLDLDHLKIGLVLEDTSPRAQSFAQALTASPYFDVKIVRDRRELESDLLRGNIRGFVVVPSYFSQFLLRPSGTAPIEVVADGSETNTANFVQNYVAGAWLGWLATEQISNATPDEPIVQIQSRFWYNEELKSRNFLIPASLAITLTLIGTLLTALVIAREWERGTMEALLSTPISPFELLASKLTAYFTLGMGSACISFIIATLFYQVPFRGSLLVLAVVTAIFLLSALGTGLLISSYARTQFVASQAGMVSSYLPAFILSGFIFEIQSMPAPIRAITYLIPARYFVSSLQTLFLVGNVWWLIMRDTLYMGLFSLLLFILTIHNTKKSLE